MKGRPRNVTKEMRDRWAEKYPEKVKAGRTLRGAVRRGIIKRPSSCEDCGRDPGRNKAGHSLVQAHHDDYSKALDVKWLCVDCHRLRHRKVTEALA